MNSNSSADVINPPARKEHSTHLNPLQLSQHRAMKDRNEEDKEIERRKRFLRLQEIRSVMKEFSGSLERQLYPKSQYEEEQGNRSYLPRRFDVREMRINRPTIQEKIHENESYLHQLDTKFATLEGDTVKKVEYSYKVPY